MTGLKDLTGSGDQIKHAYEVTGRGCRISRVRTDSLNMPSRYQVGAAGSDGYGTPNRTCLRGIRSGCRISRVRNTRPYMPTRYQDGAAGSHGFGTTVPTYIRGIWTGLQDLTGKEHQIEHVRSGLQDLTGWELQIVHANKILGRGCRISRVRNTRSYMPTWYQDGTAGSHGFGTPYRICLRGIRTGLHDLTGSEHQIVYAYEILGRGCRISRVRNTISYMPTRYQDGAA